MTRKIRIGFDPTDCFDREEMRNILREMLTNTEQIDLYLITKNSDSDFIETARIILAMDTDRVFEVADNNAVVTELDLQLIDIYMSTDNELIELVTANAETSAGVLVNDIVDNNKSQMKYITMLQFWIKQILKEIQGGAQENC